MSVFGLSAPRSYSDELWSFTPTTRAWSKHSALGSPPPSVGASMCTIGSTLYLYGGQDISGTLLFGLHTYDTNRGLWGIPGVLGSSPPRRAYAQ